MAKQKTQKEEVKKIVPYYPKLRTLIPSLGFKTTTQVFMYLRQCNVNFMYDRVYTSEGRILENIKEYNLLAKESYQKLGWGFIFIMDVPDENAIEIVHLYGISKNKFIKYLRLKAFS